MLCMWVLARWIYSARIYTHTHTHPSPLDSLQKAKCRILFARSICTFFFSWLLLLGTIRLCWDIVAAFVVFITARNWIIHTLTASIARVRACANMSCRTRYRECSKSLVKCHEPWTMSGAQKVGENAQVSYKLAVLMRDIHSSRTSTLASIEAHAQRQLYGLCIYLSSEIALVAFNIVSHVPLAHISIAQFAASR